MSFQGDFPIFRNNEGLIYLDSAATLQKSSYVIDGLKHYLENDYANIHRGWYSLSERSEQLFRESRKKVANFIKAFDESEVVFTGNATDGVNKLVQSLCLSGMLGEGEMVLISSSEHHANIVPWQMGSERYGYDIEFFNMTDDGQIDQEDLQQKYNERTKVIACSLVSNVFGNRVDISCIKKERKSVGALLVLDASQATPHMMVDVKELGADFLFFTGHKVGACTGIGILRGKKEYLKRMTPSMGGGGAIDHVYKKGYTLQTAPDKFEPGTPNLTGVVSLKLAIEYMETLGKQANASLESSISLFYQKLRILEKPLIIYCLEQFRLLEKKGVKLLGTKDETKKIGLFSFTLPAGKHPIQLGQYMAEKGVCIRCGGHCAQPLHESLGCEKGTCRISFWGYNTMRDIEKFFAVLRERL